MADFLGAILILVPAGLWVGSIATDFFSRRSQAAALLATIGHAVAALAIYAIVTNGTGALVTDGEPRFLQVLLNLVLGQAIL
ncbi:MAG: hypothetical protein HN577_09750, partial [Rhodospirillaceae bacterium]|nr:hypothetical protein [Rhodospirillaceae bacterium]